MSDHAAQAVLNIFSGCCIKFQLQRVEHLGFSGSALWKVIASEPTSWPSPLCLKRWPADHPPPARLPWMHQVLLHAAANGIDYVPRPMLTRAGQSSCQHAGSTWELMTWLPGDIDQSPLPAVERVTAAFRALARFHQATADYGANAPGEKYQTLTIHERLARYRKLQQGQLEVCRQAFIARRIPVIDDLAHEWIVRHSQLPLAILQQLEIADRWQLPLQPAIRDLWRDHVLFTGNDVSGLIDFGAMRKDTPLTDIARLLGSLAQDDTTLRNMACAAYAELLPLSERDRDLINLIDHSGALIAGWNWLDWLYVEQRQFPSLAAVRRRLHELLQRRLPASK